MDEWIGPQIEDAADDYRLSSATRREWAERALKAEAERDRLRAVLEDIADASPLMMAVTCRDIASAALKGE